MVRVEFHKADNMPTLRIEGRFAATFAQETRNLVARCKGLSRVIVDLSQITFVDAEGDEVLVWLARSGALFVSDTAYSKHLSERLGLPLAKQFQSVLPVPQSVGRGISSAGGRGRKARASSAFALNSLPTAV